MITAEVGVTRFTSPEAHWNAVTAMERETPAKSASGARIGITSAAWPDDDGTRNAIGRFTMKARIAKVPVEVPETAFSIQCRIVSVIYAFFITTVIPRARTMISAAPRKSEAPATIVVTVPSSTSREIRPMHRAKMRDWDADTGRAVN